MGRRVRKVALALVAELGAPPSQLSLLKIRRAAELIVATEEMRARALRGEHVDQSELTRQENLVSRALAMLGLPAAKPAEVADPWNPYPVLEVRPPMAPVGRAAGAPPMGAAPGRAERTGQAVGAVREPSGEGGAR
jgi:hypothetical protein